MGNWLTRRGTGTFALGMTVGAVAAIYWAWWLARTDEDDAPVLLDPETSRTIAAGALLADPWLRSYELRVGSIAPGILDVSGTVDSVEAAEAAIAAVRATRGVRTVLDRIHVHPADAVREDAAADG